MAKSNQARNVTRISGEWICRDLEGWRVSVPCQGGHKYFPFAEYGGSAKSLNAARGFHRAMLIQLEKDRAYEKKHGEKPHREVLNSRNRSGYRNIAVMYMPNLEGRPNVVYTVYWNKNRIQHSKRFSSHEYKHASYALEAAIEFRDELFGRKGMKRR